MWLPGIRVQSRKTCDAVLIGERSIKPFPVLGRYKRGNLLQHLILERATGRGDQRRQRLFLRRRNPVRDEPAKKTVHHPGSGQAQLAKLGASPRGRRPHLLPARPAQSQMVENLGTMTSPGTAKPVIDFALCRRCTDRSEERHVGKECVSTG